MPRHNPSRKAYVVRFKSGSKFRAHQFDDARSHKHAASRINNGGERVLSVRKMSPDDIIDSDVKAMKLRLRDIIGVGALGRRPDAILDDMTLDSFVFPSMGSRHKKRMEEKHRRRFERTLKTEET
jgi:hypothetical protein